MDDRSIEKRGEETVRDRTEDHPTLTKTLSHTRSATSIPTGTYTTSTESNHGYQNTSITAFTPDWFIAVYGSEDRILPEMASLGAILIALGLFLCVMGFRLFKPMLLIMGLLTFGSMTWIALANCKPSSGYMNDQITMIVVPASLGILGAALYFHFWYFTIYLVGAFGGLAIASFICTWKSNLVIEHYIGRPCFLAGMALLTGILTFFAARPMVFFATSFVGAYFVMLGVDCIARQGYIAGVQLLYNRNPYHIIEYSLVKYVYVLLAMTLTLFIISMIWQMLFNAAHQLGLHVIAAVKGKTVEEEMKEEGDMPASIHPPHSPPPPSHLPPPSHPPEPSHPPSSHHIPPPSHASSIHHA
ncbi:hypothetical protein G6F46_006218 [Rhizopus delemar]|uniref:Transmembrane protein 198 n=2 Tax=Rhizopus TaxID=4842 RepID=A0A9P7CK20_9FUNG|nr:hypothetical protein G6F55_009084 [Rhizopus delemar]KAG1537822.1 hypothetical protein G6F51_010139 [Rhizopus arrhizus]KAG1498955.1 hypothetical protein G6F54_004726 [Rhizopus delemar]KAG1513890.1 hypothetical protein G6F53_004087 [Rhizopus delemar]KAG1526548.1 hypothetical protein G6F52_002334 [Rhizopus delemar]